MSILDHLTDIRCPNCDVQLFRALDPEAGGIVFCSECLAGGRNQEVTEQRGALIASRRIEKRNVLPRSFETPRSLSSGRASRGPVGGTSG
jgi:hypothetical protein